MDYSAGKVETQIGEDSENGSSEESGSSDENVESGEEEEEDEEVGSEDDEDEFDEQLNESADNHQSPYISDGDPERECCPICLNRFLGQELGTPESCEHTFCFECIQEWSKNINTCPVDRNEFNFIHIRDAPGGRNLKRVKVKVLPKEPEDTIQEGVTLCEICHSGDREDRLLLCDGCDLAFHCECLDPPLFYIPIEEWFCPSCSGVFQNRAVAGPSHSRTRRVIPRTRASETVRSRVQNLRSGPSTASRSTSTNNRSATNYTPRKKRRKRYRRRTYKKVVQLARTKKSMSGAGKSKVAARGDTIVVTYRRRRKRRSKVKRLSKKSLASSRALPTPSAQQRIAKRLGISKPPTGSAIPQVKQSSGSRSVTRVAKLPTHSIFGDRNQLMDFSENFNEDLINTPSTSSSSLGRRISEDSPSSSTSSLNILDSIMACQKLLHSKSENIVIKTDGSLVLKESDIKKIKTGETVKTPVVSQSSRTPMSIALAKEGVKSLVLPSSKKSSFSLKNTNNTSQRKDIHPSDLSKSCSSGKVISKTNNSSNQQKVKNGSTSSKLHSKSAKNFSVLFNEDQNKRSALSSWKIPKRNKERNVKDEECDTANMFDLNSLVSESSYKSNDATVKREMQNITIKKENDENIDLSSKNNSVSTWSELGNFMKRHSHNSLISSDSSNCVSNENLSKVHVKKEIMSDEETNSNSIIQDVETIRIKQEILSDEETNMDNWVKAADSLQASDKDCVSVANKRDSTDSGSETDASDFITNDLPLRNSASESEDSDFDPSQSIIDSVPGDSVVSSQCETSRSRVPYLKIKEELPSDTEDFSQSVVSDSVTYFESKSVQPHSNLSGNSSVKHITKSGELNSQSVDSKFVSKSKDCINKSSQEDDLPCTQLAFNPIANDTENFFTSSNLSSHLLQKNVKFPNVQLPSTKQACNKEKENLSHSNKEFPATQLDPECNRTSYLSTSKNQTSFECNELKDLPETQSISSTNKLSLPATQLFNNHSKGFKNLPDTELLPSNILPATQMFSSLPENIVNSPVADCLPSVDNSCTLPATQVCDISNIATVLPNSENSLLMNESSPLPETQICNDTSKEIPATQVCDAITNMTTDLSNSENLLLNKSNTLTSCQSLNDTSNKIIDLPNTQVFTQANNSTVLPDTQVFNANLSQAPHISNENRTKSLSCDKLMSDMPSCSDDEERDSCTNMNDIISNIKQVVNSLCGKNPNSSCFDNPQTNPESNTNLELLANDNILENNLNCNEQNSQMSSSLDNNDINEDVTAEKCKNSCNDELDGRSEDQHSSTDSDSEELSHEKLKEIITKATKVNSPKEVGIHKHLPQVITIKPTKGQPRPKLPNRKTFSFEEVAKLEGPNKVIGAKNKHDEDGIFENSASDSNDTDQDNIASTQKADFEISKNVSEVHRTNILTSNISPSSECMKNSISSHFNFSSNKSTEKISNNPFNTHSKKFSSETESVRDDLPPTQVTVWQKRVLDVPETQVINTVNHVEDCDLPETQAISARIHVEDCNLPKTQAVSNATYREDCDLPATQAAVWQSSDLDVPETQIVTVNEIVEEEDLLSTQTTKNSLNNYVIDDKKNLNLRKLKKTIKFNVDETNASLGAQKKDNKVSAKNNVEHCDTQKSLKSFDHEDLPATQMFSDDHSIIVNGKVTQQSNSFGGNKELQSTLTSTSKIKNKIFDVQKIQKTINTETKNISKDHNKGFKRLNDDKSSDNTAKKFRGSVENPFKNFKANQNGNISKVSDHSRFKKSKEEENNLNDVRITKIKQEKADESDFKIPSPVIKNKTSESSFRNFNIVKIKSENIFEDDLLPPTQLAVLNTCEDIGLPPTQVANFDEMNSRNNTIVNFSHETDAENQKRNLSSTDIKKEALSDDEVSIIELDLSSHIQVKKEVITLDDEEDDNLANMNVKVKDEIILISDDNMDKSVVKVKKEIFTGDYIANSVSQTTISNSLNHDVLKKDVAIKVEKNVKDYKNSLKKTDGSLKTKNASSKSKSERKNIKPTSKHVDALQVSQSPKEAGRTKIYETEVLQSKSKTRALENDKRCKTSMDSFSLEENKDIRYEKLKSRDTKCGPKDSEKHKTSKNSGVEEQNEQKRHDAKFLKSKSQDSKGSYKDTEKCKSTKKSPLKGKSEQKNHKKESSNLKSKNAKADCKDSKQRKVSEDSSFLKEGNKQREHETNLKIRCGRINSKDAEKNKDIKDSSFKEQMYDGHSKETLRSKSINSRFRSEPKLSTKEELCNLEVFEEVSNSSLSSGHARNSSEKENNSSCKTKNSSKDIVITLKPTCRKRLHEPVKLDCDAKKLKYEQLQHSELCSGDDTSQQYPILHVGSLKDSNSIINLKADCDTDNDSINGFTVEYSSKSVPTRDLIKMSKQELKEEIANEVKMILKPFYSTGLISKDDYKDIMRRAVPKIFMNCHNSINPEKIRKLVLSYVSLLNKS